VGGQGGIAGRDAAGGGARGGEDGGGVGPVEEDVERDAEERGPGAWEDISRSCGMARGGGEGVERNKGERDAPAERLFV
jgi:hypothetical protein